MTKDGDDLVSFYNKIGIKKQPKRMPFWKRCLGGAPSQSFRSQKDMEQYIRKLVNEEINKRFE